MLAAIAIKVGLDILDWSFLKRAHRINLPTTMIMYGVMLMTVFIDLMVAVGVGVFVANVLTIEKSEPGAGTQGEGGSRHQRCG